MTAAQYSLIEELCEQIGIDTEQALTIYADDYDNFSDIPVRDAEEIIDAMIYDAEKGM